MSKAPKGFVRVTVTFRDIDFKDLEFYTLAAGYSGRLSSDRIKNMLHKLAMGEIARNPLSDARIRKYLLQVPEYLPRFTEAALAVFAAKNLAIVKCGSQSGLIENTEYRKASLDRYRVLRLNDNQATVYEVGQEVYDVLKDEMQ